MSSERRCLFCGEKLPADARQNVRYCAASCRVRAAQQRKSQLPNQEVPPAPVAATQQTAPLLRYLDFETSAVDKPAEPIEELRRSRLQQALQDGYNPAEDILAFAKLEELQSVDRLARWQIRQNVPLTVEQIPPAVDRDHLAAIGAIQERWHYHANRTLAKAKTIRWVHEGWELDSSSEAELLRQVYARIQGSLRIPRKPG